MASCTLFWDENPVPVVWYLSLVLFDVTPGDPASAARAFRQKPLQEPALAGTARRVCAYAVLRSAVKPHFLRSARKGPCSGSMVKKGTQPRGSPS